MNASEFLQDKGILDDLSEDIDIKIEGVGNFKFTELLEEYAKLNQNVTVISKKTIRKHLEKKATVN
jgi:hypothetical protein